MSIRNRLLMLGLAMILIPVCLIYMTIHSALTLVARSIQESGSYELYEYLPLMNKGSVRPDDMVISGMKRAVAEAKDEAALTAALHEMDAQMLMGNIIMEMTVEGEPFFASSAMDAGGQWAEDGWRVAFLSDLSLSDGRAARLTLHFKEDLMSYAQSFFRDYSLIISLTLLLSLGLTCGLLTYLVSLSITKPIKTLARGLREVRDGRLDAEPLPVCGSDELAQLTVGFNAMRSRLKTSVSNQMQMESNRKELLVNIAHDLRTPITSIKGYVEGIMDGVANDAQKRERYLATIRRKADEMDHLVDNLFLFSTLDMGRVQFDFERVALGPFLADCADELSYELSKQDMTITYEDHTAGSGPVVMMDRMQFKRVILNIADNSDKYKRGDTGRLAIDMYADERAATVSFADDGVGIPADMLEKVFGQFIRVDASRGAAIKGNGLGLAIARQIIDAHDGQISASGQPGQGTTITITLPLEGSR